MVEDWDTWLQQRLTLAQIIQVAWLSGVFFVILLAIQ